jgi:hypothetical protein
VRSAGVEEPANVTPQVKAVLAARAALQAPQPDLPVIWHALVESGIAEAKLRPFWPAGVPDCDHDATYKALYKDLAAALSATSAEAVVRQCRRGELVAMNYNRHRHVASCRKGRLGKDGCRFCVPFAHNIKTRLLQLRVRRHEPTHEITPDDVRWCRSSWGSTLGSSGGRISCQWIFGGRREPSRALSTRNARARWVTGCVM